IVRGSIFDTLGSEIDGASFIDLFAGSGAVGIEALSRGAHRAVFVEQDHRILRVLRTNLKRCNLTREDAEVRMGDAMRYLDKLIAREDFFDIIFADPPYSGNIAQAIVTRLEEGEREICRLLIVEHGSAVFNKNDGIIEKIRSRKFGQTMVSYFRYRRETGETCVEGGKEG
ncbi:MAG: 16S rRNA (guanine(966)-N(2))-methyltransferase RsmD, partial [Candidatus Krumholzibacteria bacterium]|nr:16S rRNA (guanine(966)-N(2))-methyltransferase RsmD [Candidatus Krumholzibacteria bacterium]